MASGKLFCDHEWRYIQTVMEASKNDWVSRLIGGYVIEPDKLSGGYKNDYLIEPDEKGMWKHEPTL